MRKNLKHLLTAAAAEINQLADTNLGNSLTALLTEMVARIEASEQHITQLPPGSSVEDTATHDLAPRLDTTQLETGYPNLSAELAHQLTVNGRWHGDDSGKVDRPLPDQYNDVRVSAHRMYQEWKLGEQFGVNEQVAAEAEACWVAAYVAAHAKPYCYNAARQLAREYPNFAQATGQIYQFYPDLDRAALIQELLPMMKETLGDDLAGEIERTLATRQQIQSADQATSLHCRPAQTVSTEFDVHVYQIKKEQHQP